MQSPELDKLFPGVAVEPLNKLKKVRFVAELEKASKANGGVPVLERLLKDNPKLPLEELLQSVHELAKLDEKWAKSSQKLRALFPLTPV